MTWLQFISKNCRKLGLKILTFKLSDFHLDDVLFIVILVQKQAFKKKFAQKFENWNPKIFQKKYKSRKIDFKIAITQKLRIADA